MSRPPSPPAPPPSRRGGGPGLPGLPALLRSLKVVALVMLAPALAKQAAMMAIDLGFEQQAILVLVWVGFLAGMAAMAGARGRG